jgi:hypothetical protein
LFSPYFFIFAIIFSFSPLRFSHYYIQARDDAPFSRMPAPPMPRVMPRHYFSHIDATAHAAAAYAAIMPYSLPLIIFDTLFAIDAAAAIIFAIFFYAIIAFTLAMPFSPYFSLRCHAASIIAFRFSLFDAAAIDITLSPLFFTLSRCRRFHAALRSCH